MAYSLDFRRRVLKIREELKLTAEQTAEKFQVGSATLFRWMKKVEPKKRNKRATKIDMKALEEDVLRCPDAYERERAVKLGVAKSTVHYALKRLGITHKKNAQTPESIPRRKKKLLKISMSI
ncbi:transposase [bacterium]|nr:MAG: transposase [bacterium]QQR61824.1 MAG: transposase [bacterium]QQR62594.1 MAG: transposase [bacterium]